MLAVDPRGLGAIDNPVVLGYHTTFQGAVTELIEAHNQSLQELCQKLHGEYEKKLLHESSQGLAKIEVPHTMLASTIIPCKRPDIQSDVAQEGKSSSMLSGSGELSMSSVMGEVTQTPKPKLPRASYDFSDKLREKKIVQDDFKNISQDDLGNSVMNKLRLKKPQIAHHVRRIHKYSHIPLFHRMLNHKESALMFTAFCSFMIVVNSIYAEYAMHNQLVYDRRLAYLDSVPKMFTVWFCIELFIRAGAAGVYFFHGADWRWNLLDTAVVIADLVEIAAGGSRFPPTIVRKLRLLRIVRTVTIIRTFSFFSGVRLMALAVINCGTILIWAAILFGFCVFLFAMYFMSLCIDLDKDDKIYELFGNFWTSMFTLFYAVTGGMDWNEIAYPLRKLHWFHAAMLVLYMFFTLFGLTNIITGIFVETAIGNAMDDHDEAVKAKLEARRDTIDRLVKFFTEVDADGSGELTLAELESHLLDEEVRACLAVLGVAIDDASHFFNLLDFDGSGSVSITEFIEGLIRLMGQARSCDMHMKMAEQKMMIAQLVPRFEKMEAKLENYSFCVIQQVESISSMVHRIRQVHHRKSTQDEGDTAHGFSPPPTSRLCDIPDMPHPEEGVAHCSEQHSARVSSL